MYLSFPIYKVSRETMEEHTQLAARFNPNEEEMSI